MFSIHANWKIEKLKKSFFLGDRPAEPEKIEKLEKWKISKFPIFMYFKSRELKKWKMEKSCFFSNFLGLRGPASRDFFCFSFFHFFNSRGLKKWTITNFPIFNFFNSRELKHEKILCFFQFPREAGPPSPRTLKEFKK